MDRCNSLRGLFLPISTVPFFFTSFLCVLSFRQDNTDSICHSDKGSYDRMNTRFPLMFSFEFAFCKPIFAVESRLDDKYIRRFYLYAFYMCCGSSRFKGLWRKKQGMFLWAFLIQILLVFLQGSYGAQHICLAWGLVYSNGSKSKYRLVLWWTPMFVQGVLLFVLSCWKRCYRWWVDTTEIYENGSRSSWYATEVL